MLRSARLLAASLVVVLALPHPRALAQFFNFPDLKVTLVNGVSQSCAGFSLVRASITFQLQNIGKVAAIRPHPLFEWVVIRDAGGGPPPPELMWSTTQPAQISAGQVLTFKAQPLLRQVPTTFRGPILPKNFSAFFLIEADPRNQILEINKQNNAAGLGTQLTALCT
jgi:hypothetical protein